MVDEMLFILFGFLLFTNITFIPFQFFEHENNHKGKTGSFTLLRKEFSGTRSLRKKYS
ncbi:hypothetical protein ADICYQ_3793 [Cyclobacterium qasimii M12-11B]|uniref:Uncharacterized protein n=1 Tax=Cyclobacterium qasimii M12-11B TaxID=641524 RepID=S7WT27_9BACT|nr:hypothetical protein ADICYQ_3793 [Cyclobacterium qasimii M12-11B]